MMFHLNFKVLEKFFNQTFFVRGTKENVFGILVKKNTVV